MELVDGVDVGEEERHQALRHGVFFDHSAAEPLQATKPQTHEDMQHFQSKNISQLKLMENI